MYKPQLMDLQYGKIKKQCANAQPVPFWHNTISKISWVGEKFSPATGPYHHATYWCAQPQYGLLLSLAAQSPASLYYLPIDA